MDYLKRGLLLAMVAALALSSKVVSGEIRVNSLFSNHAVLQKGKPIPVWGTGDEGEQVSVAFNGQMKKAVVKGGKWRVVLDPMEYQRQPQTMVISGVNKVVLSDILVGEVWICSGQSNMERQLGPRPPQPPLTNWEKERDGALFPLIREYHVPQRYSEERLEDAGGYWKVCSPDVVSDFSAVGYFFARSLYLHLNIPIGIVFSALGGTPAEDWTSKESLWANPLLKSLAKNYDEVMSKSYRPEGQTIGGLYNAMVYPIKAFAVKGVAWYQGESNNDRAEQYEAVLYNMICCWRQEFNQGDFPFLIVQVAPHRDMKPEIREAQRIVASKIKNGALVVTADCGLENEIHPPFKQPIGERLALAARALAYKEKVEYSGPQYWKAKKCKGAMLVYFKHAPNGLALRSGDRVTGFTICGRDGVFYSAEAIIKGSNVVVWSKDVAEPTTVRYGWACFPHLNLIGVNGIPASPFSSDRI